MGATQRHRRYVARHWLSIFRPALRYSTTRDAYVLRVVGNSKGPVLRVDRRRRRVPFDGVERRGDQIAA
jgi:hypothetical protein